jgi:flagellar M-ring protein FliF
MALIDSLGEWVRRVGAPRVLGVLVVLGVGLAGIWGLVTWGNAPNWVPIVQNVPFETIGAAQRIMEESDIQNELSASGAAVLVRAEDAARARVALAERGLASGERPGFELFDEPSWGMTDFTQRINYRRALEGELSRTITQMRGISSAEVHLALPESSSLLRGGQPVEASVLLSVAAGARPSTEQVEAITFLLASAVDGLTTENVSVLDDAGRVLYAAAEPNSLGRLDRRRLESQLELEEYLGLRAAELVEPLLGPANVRVRVSAQLDFEQVERRTDSVDPNEQVLTTEERSEIEPGDPTQGAASTIQHNTFDVTRSTEISTRSAGAIKRLTVAVAVNEALPRSSDPALMGRIEQLVANAVGLDPGRGDAISVLPVPFEPIQPTISDGGPPPPGALDLLREFQRPLVLAFALILMFVLALRGLGLARKSMTEGAAPLLPGTQRTRVLGADSAAGAVGEGGMETIVGVREIDPSRVVRAWLGEG